MRIDSIARKLVGWLLTAVLFVIVLEFCARLDDYLKWNAPFWAEYSEDLLSNTDSLGYRNVPNARFQKWRINNFGFRGPDITLAKPIEVIRVMTLGASETFGLYESQDKEYPAQMQQIFDSLYPGRFQVINAASAGMSLPRVTRYYKDYLYKFLPDIVIYYPTPTGYLGDDPPEPETTSYTPIIRQNRFSSRLLPKTSILIKKIIPDYFQTASKRIMINRAINNHPKGWVFEHVPPDRMPIIKRQINDLIATVINSGTHLIIATHSMRFGKILANNDIPYIIAVQKMRPRVGQQAIIEINDRVNEIIKDLANTPNVSVVDSDKLIPKDPVNFADYAHFTDEGARLMAKACANTVVQVAYKKHLLELIQ